MIRLTIRVSNIDAVILLYSYIRIYFSSEEYGTYTSLAFVPLIPGQSEYYYDHLDGTVDTWYRSSYYASPSVESSLSDPVRGSTPVLFHDITYPAEFYFDEDSQIIIRKIRRYIGDFKTVQRLYMNSEETSCTYITEDSKTIKLPTKGWPLYIALQLESVGPIIEKTSLSDPVVDSYRYLTFSGTLNSGIVNDTITIWYEEFKFADREIYEAYEDAMMPPFVPADRITEDHLILQASIDLLENMTSEDMVEDGATIRDDQTVYDPSPGLRERYRTIERLKKMLKDLVDEALKNAIIAQTGVLID